METIIVFTVSNIRSFTLVSKVLKIFTGLCLNKAKSFCTLRVRWSITLMIKIYLCPIAAFSVESEER